MSGNAFTKENLDNCLKELGKEFRRLNGKSMPAEIILIGGASVLANYGFRELTYDIDAVIMASSAMKEAANRVGDKLGLPNGWLNMDFNVTASYSRRLAEVSVYYRKFSNILTVRTVAAEYLVAMKLMSGRPYKNDLSDVAGILWEHEKSGNPIAREAIDNAASVLYGQLLPDASVKFIDDVFANGDYAGLFDEARKNEREAKELLLDFQRENPKTLTKDNLADVLDTLRKKKKPDIKERLEAAQIEADHHNNSYITPDVSRGTPEL
jgi:hypothetical protein